jgi:DNA-binding response OmpR family regulator
MKEEKTLILVAAEDEGLKSIIRAYLEMDGFAVETINNCRLTLETAEQYSPNLLILENRMPGINGYKFLEAYRNYCEAPIIIMSADSGEEGQVKALELGADDYINKPIRPRILIARVHAVLRRSGKYSPATTANHLKIGGITLNRDKHLVLVDRVRVNLTPTEFELLGTLMSHPGRAFSRLDLLEKIQGSRYVGYERTIDIHIKNLRAKIEKDPHHPNFIETIYGVGYRFNERQ